VCFGEAIFDDVFKWRIFQRCVEIEAVECVRTVAGEPVVGVSEQIVAHFAVLDHVERFDEISQAEDFEDVHVAGNCVPFRDAFVPGIHPLRTHHVFEFFIQTRFDGADYGACVESRREQRQRFHVLVEIGRARGAEAERVDLRIREAPGVVEDHWRQRRGEVDEFFAGSVELAAFIAGADDEDAHVQFRREFDGGRVELIDEIPMQIDVFETTVFERVEHRLQATVRRETDVADAALFLQFHGCFHAPAWADGLMEQLVVVDAVNAEKVDVIEFQQAHGLLEIFEEIRDVGRGSDFGLDDDFVPGQLGQDVAELLFAGAVASRGFDVIDAEFNRAVDGGFEIVLVVGGEAILVIPRLLIAHSAARKDGDLQFGFTKAAVEHWVDFLSVIEISF